MTWNDMVPWCICPRDLGLRMANSLLRFWYIVVVWTVSAIVACDRSSRKLDLGVRLKIGVFCKVVISQQFDDPTTPR